MGKNQSASNLTNIIKQDASGNITFVSGSTTLMSVSSSGAITTTGNVAGTASYASNAELLDGLDSTVFTLTSSFAAQTASFTAFTSSVNTFTASQNITNGTFTLTSSFAAQTASFTAFTASQNILNGKYATTGSNTFAGIQTVNSNLVVTGSITAQTLVVQTITSSVDFVTGSTRFGSILGNTHVFSGSVTMNPGGLFVSSSGNVGINTIDPSSKLHVVGSSLTDTFRITDASNYTIVMGYSGSANVGMISTLGSTAKLALGTNSAARLTIEGTGKVGISTSVAGDVLLNVVNGSSTGYGMNISAGSGSGNYALRVENYNGASTLLYVRGDGNIGINETSANIYAKLQVTATSGDTLALANPSAAAANVGSSIWFYGTTGYNTQGVIQTGYDGTSNVYAYMAFSTRGGSTTERMRITSGGDVLIGSATDQGTWKLQVTGNAFIRGSDTSSTNTALYIDNSSGAELCQIRNDGFFRTGLAASSPYNFTTARAVNCVIDDDGALRRSTSSLKYKTDVRNYNKGLEIVNQLRPVYYRGINDGDTEFAGLIAEDIDKLGLSEFVLYAKDGTPDALGYANMVVLAFKAIQELKAQNDTLKEILQRNNIQ